MATLTKGTTISTTTTVTAQTLHDLIEQAVIGSVTPADIVGNVKFLLSQTTRPDASLYPYWYDSNPEDPVLRVFAYPWNIWLAAGPHRFEFPLLNTAATGLAKGCMVVAGTGASTFTIGTNPTLNMVGFLQDTCASGAWGAIACQGIGWGLWASQSSGTSTAFAPGGFLVGRGAVAGVCHALTSGATATAVSGALFGMLLDSARSGTTLGPYPTPILTRIRIWGPRLGHRKGGW